MSQRPFRFDPEKGLEVLLYIASRLREDYYRVLKTLYFADKYHLERYGRPICGDHYIAMKSGVVPSGLYDFVTDVKDGRLGRYDGVDASQAFDLNGYRILLKRQPNLKFLSQSDLECLDRAIGDVSKMSYPVLFKATHGPDYEAAELNDEIPFEELAKTLPSGDELLNALRS
jgi:hypothetical protein